MNSSPSRRRNTRLAALIGAAAVSLGCAVGGGDLVAYDLPPEEGRYTFEVDSGDVQTVWEYNSAQPVEDETPELHPCLDDVLLDPTGHPCRPEPLIFLRYDLGLDLDNTLPAGTTQTVTIDTYYQQVESPPTVTELTLEVSFDRGATWQPVGTEPDGDGTFTATIAHPDLGATDGAVGLRVTAADSDGNTVEQTVPYAYGLR